MTPACPGQQILDAVDGAVERGQVHWAPAVNVAEIWVPAGLEQHAQALRALVVGGRVHGRPRRQVLFLVRVVAGLEQLLHHVMMMFVILTASNATSYTSSAGSLACSNIIIALMHAT